MAELRLKGLAASPGLAIGPVFRIGQPMASQLPDAAGDEDETALREAIEAALADLNALVADVEGEAADIIGFQIAMLEDEALSEGAFDAVSTGVPASHAWRAALDAEIADYRHSEDDYFRARSADLADIRDRVLAHLSGMPAVEAIPPGAILLGEDIAPSLFLTVDWKKGGAIALGGGSPSSHVAMLARSRDVPMVTGLGELGVATKAVVDGVEGIVILDPDPATLAALDAGLAEAGQARRRAEELATKPAILPDGRSVQIMLNVAAPSDIEGLSPEICDGIGLVRTEFLFEPGRPLPDEEAQFAVYLNLAAWAEGRPVTIRTLDVGGDKHMAGVTPEGESNPFLGLRGLRLSLARPELFRSQLRALARASLHHDIRIMLPMVTLPSEFRTAARILDEEVAALIAEGIACRRPPLGIMVEVPAAALDSGSFDADFYSIGSNDLTQYTMAAARDIAAVAPLNDTGHPAVLELMRLTVEAGRKRKVSVSICGDAAADVCLLRKLLGTGLTCLSMAAPAIGRIKAAIADLADV